MEELRRNYPETPVFLGDFHREQLLAADELVISPGVSLAQPDVAAAISAGVKVVGDIELFCRAVSNGQIVAITGSNGKSTVTSLLGEMAQRAGLNVAVGGNIGTPALELLKTRADLFILELSSFQLETTKSLSAVAATLLNISPDHMDRYNSLADYQAAKQKIYNNCRVAVYNLDDPKSAPVSSGDATTVGFTTSEPKQEQFGLRVYDDEIWLSKGAEKLLSTRQMKLCGYHHYANALAALALGSAAGILMSAMLDTLKTFSGLAHRCQWVAEIQGVRWFNDSKATNTGATIAAIKGLGEALAGHIILIAGGEGKGADFSVLKPVVKAFVGHLIVLGESAQAMAEMLRDDAQISQVDTMEQAVQKAFAASKRGDVVLLAPACASFDMFDNFEDRGDCFMRYVRELEQRSLL